MQVGRLEETTFMHWLLMPPSLPSSFTIAHGLCVPAVLLFLPHTTACRSWPPTALVNSIHCRDFLLLYFLLLKSHLGNLIFLQVLATKALT